MRKLFESPKPGQKVILTDGKGDDLQRRIVEVTPKSIRISGCNLYRFNRDGSLNKASNRQGLLKLTIKPVDA